MGDPANERPAVGVRVRYERLRATDSDFLVTEGLGEPVDCCRSVRLRGVIVGE